jgi:chemotaxis protein CheD
MVRMAEMKVSAYEEDVLTSIGLGSCVGVAILDERGRAAGLAHVVLPDSAEAGGAGGAIAKFADTAVPALAREVRRLAGPAAPLVAVIAGGSQMFAFAAKSAGSSRLDVGVRNQQAARAALAASRIRVAADAVGGATGRTMRVRLGEGLVTVKESGGKEGVLYQLAAAGRTLRRAA